MNLQKKMLSTKVLGKEMTSYPIITDELTKLSTEFCKRYDEYYKQNKATGGKFGQVLQELFLALLMKKFFVFSSDKEEQIELLGRTAYVKTNLFNKKLILYRKLERRARAFLASYQKKYDDVGGFLFQEEIIKLWR